MKSMKTGLNLFHGCSVEKTSEIALSLLDYRLHKDSEGLWVQCDRCDAWRHLASAKDPTIFENVRFVCEQAKRQCGSPSDPGVDGLFYYSRFFPGNVVWALRPLKSSSAFGSSALTWWPALIEDAHDQPSQFFLLAVKHSSESRPIAYHVTFLDTWRIGGWVSADRVVPFTGTSSEVLHYEHQNGLVTKAPKTARLIAEAVERARNALRQEKLTNRLECFSFVAHVARHRGLLKASPNADYIANGVTPKPHSTGVSKRKATEGFSRQLLKKARLHVSAVPVRSPVREPPSREPLSVSKSDSQKRAKKRPIISAANPTIPATNPTISATNPMIPATNPTIPATTQTKRGPSPAAPEKQQAGTIQPHTGPTPSSAEAADRAATALQVRTTVDDKCDPSKTSTAVRNTIASIGTKETNVSKSGAKQKTLGIRRQIGERMKTDTPENCATKSTPTVTKKVESPEQAPVGLTVGALKPQKSAQPLLPDRSLAVAIPAAGRSLSQPLMTANVKKTTKISFAAPLRQQQRQEPRPQGSSLSQPAVLGGSSTLGSDSVSDFLTQSSGYSSASTLSQYTIDEMEAEMTTDMD